MHSPDAVNDKNAQKLKAKDWREVSAWSVGLSVLFLCVLYVAVKMFLATPFAAEKASVLLSASLHQRMAVEKLALSVGTIAAQGVTIVNPSGFTGAPLLTIRSLAVAPDWKGLLTGKRGLHLLRIEGARLNLVKGNSGEWNFQQLLRYLFRKKKQPTAEFSIGNLELKDVSLHVNGFVLDKVALKLRDFSTHSSTASQLVVTGKDADGNPLRLTGTGRLGRDPDLRLSLLAPSLSLRETQGAFKKNAPLDLRRGSAHLSLAARYRSAGIDAEGRAAFDHLGIVLKQGTIPVKGTLAFAAHYRTERDEILLDRCTISLNDRIRLAATGTMQGVRKERKFHTSISCGDLRLKELVSFLPRGTLRDAQVDGRLTCDKLHLDGNRAAGITGGGGRFFLRDGLFVKGKRTVLQGVSADILMARPERGWRVTGLVATRSAAGRVPLTDLNGRFAADLSDSFRLRSLAVPTLQASYQGIPVHGKLAYAPERPAAYQADLSVKNGRLSALNEILGGKKIRFSAGTADVSLRATGRDLTSFAGELTARLTGVNGTVGDRPGSFRDMRLLAQFGRQHGRQNASGTVSVAGGEFAGNDFAGSTAWSAADGSWTLAKGTVTYRNAHLSYSEISGKLPLRRVAPTGTTYPVTCAFHGMGITAGETRLKDVSGNVAAAFIPAPGGGKLIGNGSLVLPAISCKDRPIASLTAKVALNDRNAVVDLAGKALDGDVTSVVRLDPFAIRKGVYCTALLRNVSADKLSSVLPARSPLAVSVGRITAKLDGSWSETGGVKCDVEASGDDLTLLGKGGKTLLSGAGLAVQANMAGGDITVKDAAISRGKETALKLSGNMTNVFLPSRRGNFSLALGPLPVEDLFASAIHLLPTPLQQAHGEGTAGMRGTLEVDGGKTLLQGAVQFSGASVNVPSQKINVTGIDGVLPLSVYLTGATVEKPVEPLSFSRSNYATLFDTLRRSVKKGQLLKVGKVQFGSLEAENISLYSQSGKGIVEAAAIEASLYGGTVLGKGFFLIDKAPRYGVDLLIGDMSLRQFCNAYPKLKGYISGLLDGVISLYGEKGGLSAMVGFVDLWAHGGRQEKMLVSKEFLQRLAGKKLKGFFFQNDRSYDTGQISAYLLGGYLTFEQLDISHANFLGMKDLNVTVAPVQNRIALDHLFQAIREAAARGKPATGEEAPPEAPAETDLKWLE